MYRRVDNNIKTDNLIDDVKVIGAGFCDNLAITKNPFNNLRYIIHFAIYFIICFLC